MTEPTPEQTDPTQVVEQDIDVEDPKPALDGDANPDEQAGEDVDDDELDDDDDDEDQAAGPPAEDPDA